MNKYPHDREHDRYMAEELDAKSVQVLPSLPVHFMN